MNEKLHFQRPKIARQHTQCSACRTTRSSIGKCMNDAAYLRLCQTFVSPLHVERLHFCEISERTMIVMQQHYEFRWLSVDARDDISVNAPHFSFK